MKIRVGVFLGGGRYDVEAFDAPRPPPGGMVLRVEAVGMCGSDLGQLAGDAHTPGEPLPIVPGRDRRSLRGPRTLDVVFDAA